MTCVSYPGQEAIPATPARTTTIHDLSWDAGADSNVVRQGSCRLAFTMPISVVGAVVGLKASTSGVGIPELVAYGFSFQMGPGTNFYNVIEHGIAVTAPALRTSLLDETFEIRRVRNKVIYLVKLSGAALATVIYTSTRQCVGPLISSGCLFASGDSIA